MKLSQPYLAGVRTICSVKSVIAAEIVHGLLNHIAIIDGELTEANQANLMHLENEEVYVQRINTLKNEVSIIEQARFRQRTTILEKNSEINRLRGMLTEMDEDKSNLLEIIDKATFEHKPVLPKEVAEAISSLITDYVKEFYSKQ